MINQSIFILFNIEKWVKEKRIGLTFISLAFEIREVCTCAAHKERHIMQRVNDTCWEKVPMGPRLGETLGGRNANIETMS